MKDSRQLMADYDRLEATYWFFTARLHILRRVFARYIRPGSLIANIGCGPGSTSQLAAGFGSVVSLDYSLEAMRYTRRRGLTACGCADAVKLPLRDDCCDSLLALDVMEHIEDDRAFADELHRVISPGGTAILTVPVGMWQWTKRDKVMGHYRRYSKREFGRVVAGAGFSLEVMTHFNSLLLPLNALDVLVDKFRGKVDDENCYPEFNPLLNAILHNIFRLEQFMVPWPGFPLGRSLLAVARKT